MLKKIVQTNRSYRRFHEDVPISIDTLRELVDLAKLCATSANRQPLKFYLTCDREKNGQIFPLLTWAGLLTEWPGPDEGERPAAYIIVLGDTEISKSFGVDHGIAAQSILLGATEKGLGGCMIGSIKKRELGQALEISPDHQILLVIALGQPKETVVIEAVGADGDIKYWRDDEDIHHVPKRSLDEIIIS